MITPIKIPIKARPIPDKSFFTTSDSPMTINIKALTKKSFQMSFA